MLYTVRSPVHGHVFYDRDKTDVVVSFGSLRTPHFLIPPPPPHATVALQFPMQFPLVYKVGHDEGFTHHRSPAP